MAQNSTNSTEESYPDDPIAALRPILARSLPVQLLLNGIVLTLMAVLFLQLTFTSQYHFRLAPVNFSLQVSAVCTLLVATISTIHVVLSTVSEQSQTWPYMLNYVSVNVPPEPCDWSLAARASWLLLTATTGMLIQCTHIQFLTLLFPSKLERRLIFTLLGPLALTSAAMQLIRIRTDMHVQRIALAVQNVCNATLSMLFTVSLLLWGILVNRKNAWRMDGGTAAFGVGALTLAPMSTAISLIYISSKDQFSWMKPLMWSIILWQSFLGWWWWVGAGMGVGELDELLHREEKRQKKRKQRSARRKEQRERAETLIKGITDAFGFSKHRTSEEHAASPVSSPAARHNAENRPPAGRIRRLIRHSYNLLLFVRNEHVTAAREQAAEWGERINQIYGRDEGDRTGMRGWGLGQYGVRRVQDTVDDATVVGGDSDPEMDVAVETSVHGDVDEAEKGVDPELKDDDVRRVRRRNRHPKQRQNRRPSSREPPRAQASTSMWWWGPLQRWRLQDSTEY